MATVTINIPDKYLNQLNNFYDDNFGYEIHTVLLNFIHQEMEKCKEYSDEKREFITPRIVMGRTGYVVKTVDPQGNRRFIHGRTYDNCVKILNEWSKYSFDPDKKDEIADKLRLKRKSKWNNNEIDNGLNPKYVWLEHGKYAVVSPHNLGRKHFGSYEDVEDAVTVRNFIVEHDWDMKYHPSTLLNEKPEINRNNYPKYLLKLAKGEHNETDNSNE